MNLQAKLRRLPSAIGLTCLLAAPNAHAQDAALPPRWMVNVVASGIFFPNTSAKVTLGGATVPGASIMVPSEATLTIDAGYFITRDLAVDVYAGVPPLARIVGTGPLRPLATLATTYYGPAVLALQYYVPGLGAWRPYVGLGLNYTLFLVHADKSLTSVEVPNAFGAAFEVGLRYEFASAWTFNADLKYIALNDRISAQFQTSAVALPAVAKAAINPLILGIGFGYRF